MSPSVPSTHLCQEVQEAPRRYRDVLDARCARRLGCVDGCGRRCISALVARRQHRSAGDPWQRCTAAIDSGRVQLDAHDHTRRYRLVPAAPRRRLSASTAGGDRAAICPSHFVSTSVLTPCGVDTPLRSTSVVGDDDGDCVGTAVYPTLPATVDSAVSAAAGADALLHSSLVVDTAVRTTRGYDALVRSTPVVCNSMQTTARGGTALYPPLIADAAASTAGGDRAALCPSPFVSTSMLTPADAVTPLRRRPSSMRS